MPTTRVYELGATLWQVLPDLATGDLALLTLDADMNAQISIVSAHSGLLRPLFSPEFSWNRLLDFREGVLLLKRSEGNHYEPSPGLRAYAVDSAKLVWERPDDRAYAPVRAGLLLYPRPGLDAQMDLLDLRNGECIAQVHERAEAQALAADWADEQAREMGWPERIPPEDERYGAFAQLLQSSACGSIDYMQTAGGGRAWAWHEGKASDLRLHLRVLLADGAQRDVLLETGMKAMNPEPFFRFRDRVIAVAGRRRLVVVEL